MHDSETTAGRRARPRISTPATHGAISAERGNFHEQERQGGIRRPRAQVQQSNREPPTAVSRVPPPPHVRILANFIRLLPLASYCADATERRASAAPKATDIHKTRNPRPFTGFFFGAAAWASCATHARFVEVQHSESPPAGVDRTKCDEFASKGTTPGRGQSFPEGVETITRSSSSIVRKSLLSLEWKKKSFVHLF